VLPDALLTAISSVGHVGRESTRRDGGSSALKGGTEPSPAMTKRRDGAKPDDEDRPTGDEERDGAKPAMTKTARAKRR
jgi:hypothetical protein